MFRLILALVGIVCISKNIFAQPLLIAFENKTPLAAKLEYKQNCVPRPGDVTPEGYVNSGKTAVFSCGQLPHVIKLTQYNGPYAGDAKCHLEYDGYKPSKHCQFSNNKMIMNWVKPAIQYQRIQKNVQTVVTAFNAEKRTSLIPNVIPLNRKKLDEMVENVGAHWSLQFGYDSSRYPLFNGAYCLANRDSQICREVRTNLLGMLDDAKKTVRNQTLPAGGIWAYTVPGSSEGQPVDHNHPEGGSPALDGPIAVAEYAMYGETQIYKDLIKTLEKYSIAKNTPESARHVQPYTATSAPYFNATMSLLSQAVLVGKGEFESTRQAPVVGSGYVSKQSFINNYNDWKKKEAGFLADFIVTDELGVKHSAKRVVFSVVKAPCTTEDNWVDACKSPAVSEGLSYGLLIAYAANDQQTFDELLRFIQFTARTHGCAAISEDRKSCALKSNYLMPWLVDQTGKAIHYTIAGGYWTNGSATDADINIAWALKLAADAVVKGDWKPGYQFNGKSYLELAKAIETEVAHYVINQEVKFFDRPIGILYGPGSQWGQAGRDVFYPGYDAPQAFDALDALK